MKGLSLLILLFFVGNIFAQKLFKNSITTHSTDIFVEFNIIDQVEIIVINNDNLITVIAESEDNQSPNLVLEDKNGIVFITSIENSLKYNREENDKMCSIQPVYTSYKIFIPEDKNLYVSYSQGNFYSNQFNGKLNLKLNDGIVKISHFSGKVSIQIGGGNVFCSQIENSYIDVKSNLGFVSSNLLTSNDNQKNNELKEVFGNRLNELNIRAISANIHLTRSMH